MTTPKPSLYLNLNGRSRSPSPSQTTARQNFVHSTQPSRATVRQNFLNPGNTNLVRARRSVPAEPSIKEDANTREMIPLLKAERMNPPLANPEAVDLGDDRVAINGPNPEVDNGFLFDRLNPDGPTIPETDNAPDPANPANGGPADPVPVDDVDGRRVYPARGFVPSRGPLSPSPNFSGLDGKPQFPDFELGTIADLESIPDVNIYQHKKTLAQGMMDLALFSANANQLRYVLESNMHPYFYPGVILISISLVLQVAIGVGLIWNSRYNVKDEKEICIANKINNFTIIGIFLVTVVNVFISAFGVASSRPATSSGP